MRDVLCIYYSRTGNTKRVMETIAKEMDAELLALTDGVERSGLRGSSAPRCGPDGAAAWCAAF